MADLLEAATTGKTTVQENYEQSQSVYGAFTNITEMIHKSNNEISKITDSIATIAQASDTVKEYENS